MSTQADRVQVLNTAEVLALNGRSLGPTPWFTVHQERVDAFARAVADWHWAHNDVERAARGPFGGTIGHAHLTLSLVPHLFASLLGFAAGEDAMFYGYNRVRFPAPVPVGSNIRLRADIVDADDLVAASSSPWTSLSSSTGQTGRRVLPRHCSGHYPRHGTRLTATVRARTGVPTARRLSERARTPASLRRVRDAGCSRALDVAHDAGDGGPTSPPALVAVRLVTTRPRSLWAVTRQQEPGMLERCSRCRACGGERRLGHAPRP